MILGRTSEGKIQIKQDPLRAVNCACCGPQVCDGCGAYATLTEGGDAGVFEDWVIASNPGQSMVIDSFQFPEGIPIFIPPGEDPDSCGSTPFDYTSQLPALSGSEYREYFDGMYYHPSNLSNAACGIYRAVFYFYPFGDAMTARVRKGKSPVTGECGWLVSFFLYIADEFTDSFLTTYEHFFPYSAFPGTVSFSATGIVEFLCYSVSGDYFYTTGEITFSSIVTVNHGTPYCFEETCY